tara:strand:- start:33 stop:764 length:732 start_codon:yes stop_codon:yes gene_type:complete
MKKTIFIITILFNLQTFSENSLFLEANQQYNKQNYKSAILLYDSIIANGLESSELYYNLGNCYYKKEEWANAIWNYEKSLSLKKNTNTLENLELTKLKITDKIEPIPQLFYKKWWRNTINLVSVNMWQILTLLCIWIILIVQIITRFTTSKHKYSFHFLTILFIILLSISLSSYHENYQKPKAIIFSSSVNVNSAPTEDSKNLFSLHAGTKVRILDNIGDWINIKIEDGKNGWIKKSNCRILE